MNTRETKHETSGSSFVMICEWLSRCAGAQQRGETFPEASLFRTLVHHGAFFVITSESDTRDVHINEPVAAVCRGQMQRLNGLHLAAELPASLSSLRFFFSDNEQPLQLSSSQVEHFRSFLQVIVIEQLLARLHAGAEVEIDQPFARIRDFQHFFVLSAHSVAADFAGEVPLRLALAPDPQAKRKLAAVFTARDALQLFVAAREGSVAEQKEQLVSVKLSGLELFTHLASVSIDGIVINPFGPIRPIPFLQSITTAILDKP